MNQKNRKRNEQQCHMSEHPGHSSSCSFKICYMFDQMPLLVTVFVHKLYEMPTVLFYLLEVGGA